MIAHDKGKPAVRQGRKAVSLQGDVPAVLHPPEIVWLPKAIGEWPTTALNASSPNRRIDLAEGGGQSGVTGLRQPSNLRFRNLRLPF